MEHILKIQPRYFNYINNGTKRIELRLYDEKTQQITIGDTILFQKLIPIYVNTIFTKQELIDALNGFYTSEQQKQYGVLGIRIEKI